MDRKTVKDLSKKRDALITGLLGKLENKVQSAQRGLLKTVLEDFVDGLEKDDAGNIKNTIGNKRRFAMFDKVFNRYAMDKGLEVVKAIAEGVGGVINFNERYYSAFAKPAQLAPIQSQVKETLNAWLGITDRGSVAPNGYLDTLIKSDTVKNGIKNMVLKSVISQGGYNDLKKTLGAHIEGNKEKTGALQKYYRNFAYDTYSVADRTAGKITADKLKFNYAIYEGGLIETSREFCEEHNGQVYSCEEIADMMPEKAIPPNYDPFTDMGGYGCRHHWNWVPDEIAFAMRPELKDKPKGKPIAPPVNEIEKPPEPLEVPQAEPPKPGKFKTIEEGKEPTAQLFRNLSKGFNIEKVEVHKDLSLETFNQYTKQLEKLTSEYNVFPGFSPKAKPVLQFASSSKYYGVVTTAAEGSWMYSMNFGHITDTSNARKYVDGQGAVRAKSRVDDENLHLATVTHEFAHVISLDRQGNAFVSAHPEILAFWKEIGKLKRAYKKELSNLSSNYLQRLRAGEPKDDVLAAMGKIHLGDYASTNANEFMAEGFTEYKLSSNPSKYAKEIGKLIDKYFKK